MARLEPESLPPKKDTSKSSSAKTKLRINLKIKCKQRPGDFIFSRPTIFLTNSKVKNSAAKSCDVCCRFQIFLKRDCNASALNFSHKDIR